MVLQLASSLRAVINSENLTLTRVWRITRSDGTILRFTSFDQNLVIDGVYLAGTGFTPSATENFSSLNSSNQTLGGILDSSAITEADLDAGLYDNAKVECMIVNYLDLPSTFNESPPKHILVFKGLIGKITKTDINYSIEVRGTEDLLNSQIGHITSKTCRYRFGDGDCGVNLTSYTHSGSVTAVSNDRRIFTVSIIQNSGFFDYGTCEFTSGNNNGVILDIAFYTASRQIHLFETTPRSISVGNNVTLVAGCTKTLLSCMRYNNVIRFGGEPHIPTADKFLATDTVEG